jgi:hypothetical protein
MSEDRPISRRVGWKIEPAPKSPCERCPKMMPLIPQKTKTAKVSRKKVALRQKMMPPLMPQGALMPHLIPPKKADSYTGYANSGMSGN